MSIRKIPLEELELLSYMDIAYEIIKEDKKQMTTPELLGEVCKLLELSMDDIMDVIGEFYMNLTTDRRFILLDGKWDLREFHSVKPVMDEEDEEEEEEEEDNSEELETEDDDFKSENDDEDEDDVDDLGNLVIVDEDELED